MRAPPAGTILPRRLPGSFVGLLILLGAGCGAHPVAQPGQAVTPDAVSTPAGAEPSGPFDRDHRDEAIALARRALQKKLGEVVLRKPTAEYLHTHVQPQLPGQPETPVAIGWMVSFLVSPGSDSEVSGDHSAPGRLGPPPLDQQSTVLNGRPQIDLVRQSMPSAGPVRHDRTASPGAFGPNALGGQAPPPVHDMPMIQPGADSTATASRHGVFVQVDGTVTPM